MEAFVASLEAHYGASWLEYKARLLATVWKPNSPCLRTDRLSSEEVLPTMTMPTFSLPGGTGCELSGVSKPVAQQLPNVTFVSLPGLNHL